MTRRRPPHRDSDVQAPPQTDELFVFSAYSLTALADRYGSLDRARLRETHLFQCGVLDGGRHSPRDWSEDGGLQLIDGLELRA